VVILADAGVTTMDTNSAAVIVNVAVLEVIPEKFALIVVVPSERDVARPFEPDVLLTVATPICDELQVTEDVISCVVLSVNVPVAINCWVFPRAMLLFIGVTAIDTKTAEVTVSVAEGDVTPEISALIIVEPTARDVASPFEFDALLIMATTLFDESQVANVVKSCTRVPSARVPEAVNCCAVPLAMLVLVGDTKMDATADVVSVAEPVTPP